MAGSGVQEQIRTTDQVVRSAGRGLVTVDGSVAGSPLLVSVSGLRDGILLGVTRFMAAMEQHDTTPSLLVVPHAGKNWSLRGAPAVLDWLRRRSNDGIEIVLAEFGQSVRGRGTELALLSEHEARLCLTAATRQMRAMGFETDVFAPPKWTMPPETMNVLLELGFRVAADRNGARDLTTGAVDSTHVLAIDEGFGGADWWCRTVRSLVQHSLGKGHAVRIFVDASKLRGHKLYQDVADIIDQAANGGAQPVNHSSVLLGRELFEGMEQVGQSSPLTAIVGLPQREVHE